MTTHTNGKTTALARTNGASVPATTDQTTVAFTPDSFERLYAMAEVFAASDLVSTALRNKPANVAITIATGLELGLSPMQSLRLIHVWNAKPSLSSDLIVALVKRSPTCKMFRLVESTDKVATYKAQRVDDDEPTTMSYTIEQAKRAGLTNKDVWKAHTEAMLRARASAALARVVFPDVAAGLYTEDEGEEMRREGRPTDPPATVQAESRVVPDNVTTDADAERIVSRLMECDTVDAVNKLAQLLNREFPNGHAQRQWMIERVRERREGLTAPQPAAVEPEAVSGEVVTQ